MRFRNAVALLPLALSACFYGNLSWQRVAQALTICNGFQPLGPLRSKPIRLLPATLGRVLRWPAILERPSLRWRLLSSLASAVLVRVLTDSPLG